MSLENTNPKIIQPNNYAGVTVFWLPVWLGYCLVYWTYAGCLFGLLLAPHASCSIKSCENILSSYLLIYSRPVPTIEPTTRFFDYKQGCYFCIHSHCFLGLSCARSGTPLSRVLLRNPIIIGICWPSWSTNSQPCTESEISINVYTVTIPWGRLIPFTISHLTSLQSIVRNHHGQVDSTHASYIRAPGITARPEARISWSSSRFYWFFPVNFGTVQVIPESLPCTFLPVRYSLLPPYDTMYSVGYREYCHTRNKQLRCTYANSCPFTTSALQIFRPTINVRISHLLHECYVTSSSRSDFVIPSNLLSVCYKFKLYQDLQCLNI